MLLRGSALLWVLTCWCWKEWTLVPEPCRMKRSAHSRAWPFLFGQKLTADGRSGPLPLPRLTVKLDRGVEAARWELRLNFPIQCCWARDHGLLSGPGQIGRDLILGLANSGPVALTDTPRCFDLHQGTRVFSSPHTSVLALFSSARNTLSRVSLLLTPAHPSARPYPTPPYSYTCPWRVGLAFSPTPWIS